MESFQVVAEVRLEGKIKAQDYETAKNEAESIIRGSFKNLKWLQLIDTGVTATRRIFG